MYFFPGALNKFILSTLMMGKKLWYVVWQFWLGSFWIDNNKINEVNVFLYFGVFFVLYSLCNRNVWVNGTLIIPISTLKHTANFTVRLVWNSCQRQPLPWWYGTCASCLKLVLSIWEKNDERNILTTGSPHKLSDSVYSMFFWGAQC